MFRSQLRLLVLSLALVSGACSSGRAPQTGPLPPSAQKTRVQVANNNWADMTVYVESNGTRQRLGTVTAQTRQVFVVPPSLMTGSGGLQLRADPIGGRGAHLSFPVQVWPGQTVEFIIQNHLASSSVLVR